MIATPAVPSGRMRFFFCIQLTVLMFAMMPFSMTLLAQEPAPEHVGFPVDWSSRHILFTNHASPESFAAASRDPRLYYNWLQRSSRIIARGPGERPLPPSRRRTHIQVDWAMSLGPGTAGGNGGMPLGESPAKYSFSTTSYSCANDFAVFTINATPAAGQANVVAFNNLYTGTGSSSCPYGPQTPPTTDYTQPTFLWSYEAGSAGSALSPTLSLDGTKVAFIETSTPAYFDVLTWVAGQGTDATHPVVPGSGGSSLVRLSYTTSAATGCNASAGNSNSSPYIDYGSDSAYIAANNGILYRITGVFKGTPTVAYCITVKANKDLTSPVYDEITNQVFVSDGLSVYSYTPGASSFTAGGSIVVASTGTDPLILSPIVDTTNGFVYVFSANGSGTNKNNSVISQINLALTSQVQGAIGPTGTPFILDGDFDNAYFTSGPDSGAGTVYVCGAQTGAGAKPGLYGFSFSSPDGIMNSTPVLSNNQNINGASNPNGSCSPLLDFFDGTTDRLFVGTGSYNATTGANLVTEWNTTARITSSSTTPNATASGYWGGTSAFSVDNVSPDPQTTSIYFGTLNTPPSGGTTPCGTGVYCAVKLTQNGLQ